MGNSDFELEYDCLVIAVGAQVNTFNTPGVSENCHFLKVRVFLIRSWDLYLCLNLIPLNVIQEIEDAQRIRRTVIDCFEKAILPGLTEEERRINLHFVIVGGGPTGVEFAAELHDFIYEDLINIYPSVKDFVKISVIQSGDHILNS